jgi:hypothetical protein
MTGQKKPAPGHPFDVPFAERMWAQATALRAAAEAAFLPAVRSQLMSRVIEYENAALAGERDAGR